MPTITVMDNENASAVVPPRIRNRAPQVQEVHVGDAFKEVLDKGLEQMKEHGATKWLSDDRANSALRPEDSAWANEDWTPRVLAAGWKYWAIVLPQNVIGRMNMQQFIDQQSQAGVTVRVFSDPNEALSWLDSV